jgi:hypothetical protein
MNRILLAYGPALLPLLAAAVIAGALLPVTSPLTAWAGAALAASAMFLVLLLARPRPRRRTRAPLSMSDLARFEPALAEPPLVAENVPLVSPEIDAALRETLDELRRLARV